MEIRKYENKEGIIAEYLVGNTSYRKLGDKWGIDFRIIHSWVMKYKGKTTKAQIQPKKESRGLSEPLPTEIKKLQEELRKSKLHIELLNAIIDIGGKELGVDLRKKSGAKR
jgi:transposase-like protein